MKRSLKSALIELGAVYEQLLLYQFSVNKEANVPSRKTQHLKRKSKAAKASAPQDPEDFVPSEEFTQMILGEQKNGEWREVDADDLIAELRASIDLAEHMEGLQAQSQSYLAKIGAPKDEDEAMSLLLRAAARDDLEAQHHLGVMYATRRPQIPQDHTGLRDSIHAHAEQSKKDDDEAMFWLVQAAERGNFESALAVGLMYNAGRGCRRNRAEAIKWIEQAANQGSDAARKWLESRER